MAKRKRKPAQDPKENQSWDDFMAELEADKAKGREAQMAEKPNPKASSMAKRIKALQDKAEMAKEKKVTKKKVAKKVAKKVTKKKVTKKKAVSKAKPKGRQTPPPIPKGGFYKNTTKKKGITPKPTSDKLPPVIGDKPGKPSMQGPAKRAKIKMLKGQTKKTDVKALAERMKYLGGAGKGTTLKGTTAKQVAAQGAKRAKAKAAKAKVRARGMKKLKKGSAAAAGLIGIMSLLKKSKSKDKKKTTKKKK